MVPFDFYNIGQRSSDLSVNRLDGFDLTRRAKIEYKERRLSEFIAQLCIDKRETKNLKVFLINLQKIISKLDSYCELNWHVQQHEIDAIFEKIIKVLSSTGVNEQLMSIALDKLNKYLSIELNFRNGESPTLVNIDEFYQNKINDIQLQRYLVCSLANRNVDAALFGAWIIFDKVGKILDEVRNIQRDHMTNNCNRLLILGMQNGTEITIKTYDNYILQLEQLMLNYLSNNKLVGWFLAQKKICLKRLSKLSINEERYSHLEIIKIKGKR
jgi:hypothetical protein